MNVIVRFYWQHDLDLVALNMHPEFKMSEWMKRAVIAYAKGDTGFHIPLPSSMPYRVELENCYTHFILVPGKDDDIIECLTGFRYGFRNSSIKTIFRSYLDSPYLDVFYNEKTYGVKARGKKRRITPGNTLVPPLPQTKNVTTSTAKNRKSKQSSSLPEITESEKNYLLEVQQKYPTEPILDLSDEDKILNDGDSFDMFSAVSSMIGE